MIAKGINKSNLGSTRSDNITDGSEDYRNKLVEPDLSEELDRYRRGDQLRIGNDIYIITDFYWSAPTYYVSNPSRVKLSEIRACRLEKVSNRDRALFTTKWLDRNAKIISRGKNND